MFSRLRSSRDRSLSFLSLPLLIGYAQQEDQGGSSLWWVWVLVILILLVLFLWWWFSREKQKEATPPSTTSVGGTTATQIPPGAEAAPAEKAEPAIVQTRATSAPVADVPVKPDDLTILEGIGPKTNSVLQAAGILTFAQLAATDVSRLEELVRSAGYRYMDPTTWPDQAKLAAAGDWDGLKKLTDELRGGRRVT